MRGRPAGPTEWAGFSGWRLKPSGADMLVIAGLHHLALVCRDVGRTEVFYRDLLGFSPLPRPPFDFRGAWIYRAGLQIHLIEDPASTDGTDARPDSRRDHVAFHVEDVDAARAELTRQGVTFQERVNAGGIRQLFFCDPDGHTIELARHAAPEAGWVPGLGGAGDPAAPARPAP